MVCGAFDDVWHPRLDEKLSFLPVTCAASEGRPSTTIWARCADWAQSDEARRDRGIKDAREQHAAPAQVPVRDTPVHLHTWCGTSAAWKSHERAAR